MLKTMIDVDLEEKLRILVISISTETRLAFSKILNESYEVVEAAHGGQAWEILNQDDEICAVFTDIEMPGADGFWLLQHMRTSENEELKSMPVVVFTNSAANESVIKNILQAGATDHIATPFNSTALQACAKANVHIRDQSLVDSKLSILDPLTKLASRSYFLKRGEEELAFANRHKTPLTVLVVSIDNFEKLQTQYDNNTLIKGIIRKIGVLVSADLRIEDLVARIDMSVFGVLMMYTDLQQASLVANRMFKKIKSSDMGFDVGKVNISVSMGCASLPGMSAKIFDDLISEANNNLAKAISAGGNRIFPEVNASDKVSSSLATESVRVDDILKVLKQGNESLNDRILLATLKKIMPLMQYCDAKFSTDMKEQLEKLYAKLNQ